jgi:positive regulator of sigma E activity
MLLLLRYSGHTKIANILSVLSTVAGLAMAVLTHNQTWLITGLLGLGLSFLQLRRQRRVAAAKSADRS